MDQQTLKDRVMLSGEDLDTLCTMVRDKIRDLSTPEPETDKLTNIYIKLGRARSRIRLSQLTKKDSGPADP